MKKIRCLGIEFEITLSLIQSIISFEGDASEKYKGNMLALATLLFNTFNLEENGKQRIQRIYDNMEKMLCFYVKWEMKVGDRTKLILQKSDFEKLAMELKDNSKFDFYELYFSYERKYEIWGYVGEKGTLVVEDVEESKLDGIILY